MEFFQIMTLSTFVIRQLLSSLAFISMKAIFKAHVISRTVTLCQFHNNSHRELSLLGHAKYCDGTCY